MTDVVGILGGMGTPEDSGPDDADDLMSALEVIEDQPLVQRAAGYAALHDELARRLDAVNPVKGSAEA